MDPLSRRRLPPSVRSLLTDIGPKEESHCSDWSDSEPCTVTREGVVLPSRGAAKQEDLLTPAKARNKEGTHDGHNTRLSPVCGLCKSNPSCYTCPRCNLPYCGLGCYRSPDHSACSEEFYKEAVLQELKDMGQTEIEGRRKMQDILLGLRKKGDRTEGGMENVLREAGIVSSDDEEVEGEAKERVQVLELLSRLAVLQQSGEGSATEIEAILRKLKEIGGRQGADEELLAADDDNDEDGELSEGVEGSEQELDLAHRLSGLDIDTLSEEEIWELLNSQEKEKFVDLIKGGAVGGLVPLWKPWWEAHEEGGGKLVEVLGEELSEQEGGSTVAGEAHEPAVSCCVKRLTDKHGIENKVKKSPEIVQNESKSAGKVRNVNKGNRKDTNKVTATSSAVSSVPPISVKIPKLSSLSSNPSPLIRYSLVNALFGYTFTMCLFNGDIESLMLEFCDTILSVSEALNSSRVFNSVQEAVESGEAALLAGGYFDREDPHAPARAVEAVAHIMTGRSRRDAAGYCLAGLSQLRSVLSKARAALPKGEDGGKRQKYFLAGKKCEFFQAWALESSQQIRRLAMELWNEHGKKQSERNIMDKAKTAVEESLKKRERKGVLIEELS
ncbi:zinc finger HIT domain-containing protein 2 [Myripristis murdjan]|uniref:Zinc finger, HIT-type containing 2 n=1 Tax=Myripristis murdjan TaxID=586833 RepID=A0A667XIK6_9TELE|nr:zinc finger HIT domain-containing protein 2 [Myripristis murdjan]